MKNTLIKAIRSSVVAVLAVASIQVFAAGESAISGKYLGVFQTTGLPDSGFAPGFTARIGTVRFDEDRGLNLKSQGAVVPHEGKISSVPYVSYDQADPLVQSEFLRLGGLYQQGAMGTFLTQLKSFMTLNGATNASYTYRQRIIVKNNPVPKFLTWRLLVDSLGRPRYSSPRIVPTTPTYVHIKYWPKKLEEGLPDAWAFPNKGTYSYQLVDKDMNPVNGMVVVDTNGAYDEPVAAIPPAVQPPGCSVAAGDTEGSCDPDFMVNCLADKKYNAACPTAYPDGLALMDLLGADGVFIDYTRKIQPLYKGSCDTGAAYNEDEGTCADGSDPVEVAQVVIDVKSRDLVQSACLPKAVYKNDIDFGYKLQYTTDRFAYNPESGLLKTGTNQVISLSPTQNYKPEMSLYPIPSNLANLIINPITQPVDELINVNQFSNIINLAPVNITYSGQPTYIYDDAYPTSLVNGGTGTQNIRVKVECVGGTISVYYSAKQGGNAYSMLDPGPSPPAVFSVGTPANKTTGWAPYVKRVSMDQSTTFCYDGNERITMCSSAGWDGYPGDDEIWAPAPPPRGVAWCPAGSTATHNYSPYSTSMSGYITTQHPQVSNLVCIAPPSGGYGACASSYTTSSCPTGQYWGCTSTYWTLYSSTATSCTYKAQSGFTTTYSTQARPYSCPAGVPKFGTGCSYGSPQFYIKLQ